MFDSYSRDQLRQTYSDAWRKFRAGVPLAPLEAMIADVIGLHPEYQPMLRDAEASLAFAPDAESGENPFLHLGLHLAVREQIAVDRPPGVRDLLERLQARFGNRHDAEHILMEALAEALWEAQRSGRPPDVARYLGLARDRCVKLALLP
jgi:hypothetical protein